MASYEYFDKSDVATDVVFLIESLVKGVCSFVSSMVEEIIERKET